MWCLKNSKATGLDNIPARFLKDGAEIISLCVTHIVLPSVLEGFRMS